MYVGSCSFGLFVFVFWNFGIVVVFVCLGFWCFSVGFGVGCRGWDCSVI